MPDTDSLSSFAQLRQRLAEWLRTYRPTPRTYITAACVGATVGQYAAIAGSSDPTAIAAAVAALGAQLGVNLLADIIGSRPAPPALTVEQISEAVQARLEAGDDLPAVRVLINEFDLIHLAMEAWEGAGDARFRQLQAELAAHPQLVAKEVVSALDPRLAGIERSQQEILYLLQQTQQELLRRADASTSLGRPVSPAASAAQETLAQIFLSYAPEDKGRVEELYGRLRNAGLRPWMASQDLLPGEDKDFATRQAIRQSHFILACLSNNGIQQRGPVQRQLKMALDLWQEQLEDDIYLIPVRLDDCALPDKLRDFEPVDLFEPEGWPRLLRALQAGTSRRMPAVSQAPGQPAPNPFGDVGRLTDPARFWDREELLRRLFEEMNKGVNLSLVGEAQVGKSSVLSMICTYGPQRMHKAVDGFIYLSLEEVDDEDEFYAALCDRLGIDACRGYKLTRALQGRRYVLCIDEVEKLGWEQFGFTRKVRSHLRGLADGSDAPFTLVVASRSPLAHLFPDSSELDSPLAAICHQIDVGPFTSRETRAFLAQRLFNTGITFTPAQIDTLLVETRGHPGSLQRAAADLYRKLSQPE